MQASAAARQPVEDGNLIHVIYYVYVNTFLSGAKLQCCCSPVVVPFVAWLVMSQLSGFEGFFGSEEEAAAFVRTFEETTNTHYVIVKQRKSGASLLISEPCCMSLKQSLNLVTGVPRGG